MILLTFREGPPVGDLAPLELALSLQIESIWGEGRTLKNGEGQAEQE